jgi:DNA-binding Lrp family transcriptional regulator
VYYIGSRRLRGAERTSAEQGSGSEGDSTMAIKAYVLVVTDPGQTRKVLEAIKSIPAVMECHEVMGPYDIVAELKVENLTELSPVLSQRLRGIPGIESTTSLVTFPQ